MVNTKEGSEVWELRLYIAGQTPKSIRAIENLKRISKERLKDKYKIKVIDIREHPEVAKSEQIIATPTLLKEIPLPLRQLIGDLSDAEKVLIGLGIQTIKK